MLQRRCLLPAAAYHGDDLVAVYSLFFRRWPFDYRGKLPFAWRQALLDLPIRSVDDLVLLRH